jgi:hypothetical protein
LRVKSKNQIIYVSPKKIKYCIFPSKYCDYTQFELSKTHPHAGVDRGVFEEDPKGYVKINNSNWDKKPGVLFSKLLEYKALFNHYTGKENWKKSKFAARNVDYIKLYQEHWGKSQIKDVNYKKFLSVTRGFTNYNSFLNNREKQIDDLFNSILKKGVYPNNTSKKNTLNDNISVVLTKKDEVYFNNRGHHRLAIAKILKLRKVPIKIIVAKNIKKLESFYKIAMNYS